MFVQALEASKRMKLELPVLAAGRVCEEGPCEKPMRIKVRRKYDEQEKSGCWPRRSLPFGVARLLDAVRPMQLAEFRNFTAFTNCFNLAENYAGTKSQH